MKATVAMGVDIGVHFYMERDSRVIYSFILDNFECSVVLFQEWLQLKAIYLRLLAI